MLDRPSNATDADEVISLASENEEENNPADELDDEDLDMLGTGDVESNPSSTAGTKRKRNGGAYPCLVPLRLRGIQIRSWCMPYPVDNPPQMHA